MKDNNAKPSDIDISPEIEDFATVVALAKTYKRVDSKSIIVAGKSRVTIIAWQTLRNDSSLKGLCNLPPVCSKDGFTVYQLYDMRIEAYRHAQRLELAYCEHNRSGHLLPY